MNTLWLVCFTGRDEKIYWWDRFIGRDFKHCFIIQYQDSVNQWILMDWRTGVCDLVIFKSSEMSSILNMLRTSYGRMVLFNAALPEKESYYRIPLMYCVQAALQVLGLPTRWTFTPKQLYKRLINSGGQEIINYRTAENG